MKLILKKPVKFWFITQNFGNVLEMYTGLGFKGHSGMDLATGHGTEIYASHDGTAYYQIDEKGGHGVVIITDKQYEYNGGEAYFKTIYWHLIDPIKEPEYKSPIQDFPWGKQVKAGDLIGYSNNTGFSTGDHLHYGLKPVAKTGESNNSWGNLEQKNGYFGAIDPLPYMEGVTPSATFVFMKDLKLHMTHPDVLALQKWLNNNGYPVATSGAGSKGLETSFFGGLTFAAVKRFQKANNLPQTGFFGPLSRGVINKIK